MDAAAQRRLLFLGLRQITIDASGLAEVILDVVVRHHGLPDSIVSDRGSVYTSKFLSSVLGIKRRLSTAFEPPPPYGRTEGQNYTIEPYNRAQELQKRAHDTGAKSRSYALDDKVYSLRFSCFTAGAGR